MLGRFLSGYVAGSGEYTAFMSGEEAGRPLSDRLFEAQSELIRRLAQRGPGIFVGRCADYVLGDYSNVINTFVISFRFVGLISQSSAKLICLFFHIIAKYILLVRKYKVSFHFIK